MSESHQIRDAGMPLSPGLETSSATSSTLTPGLAQRTACLVIALVVTIGYANSLNCGFAQDDVYVVTVNRAIRDLPHIYRAFAQPYWGTGYEELATYRPVVNISLALNYAVHGFHPLGYHFVNLVLHTINCWLLYGLVCAYTRWSQLALFTALLFAAHPVHVEAVTQVVGRTELLAAGFGFLSWHAYLRIGEGRHWRWLAWAAFAGGMYAKESALTLIGVIGLAELCAGRLRTRQEWQRAALDATGYLVVAASYIFIRRIINGQFGVHSEHTYFQGDPWYTRVLTMSQGMVEYFRLLTFPYKLCAFYDFSFFPKVSTITPRVAGSLMLVASVIGVGLWAWRRQPLVAFAILMFFVPVSLVSNIVFPTGLLIAERVLYVPSVSICLLGGLGLATLYRQSRHGRYAAVGLCVVILGLMCWRTITRNPDWTDNKAYGRALVRDAPGNPKGWMAMAKTYRDEGDLIAAEVALQYAIAISTYPSAPRVALGNLYLLQGRLAEAEESFRAAITSSNPPGWHAYFSLANLLARQGRTAEALQCYETGKREARKRRYVPSAEILAGTAAGFYRGGHYLEALRIYEDALRRDPLLAEAWAGYGLTRLRLHQLDEARMALEQAVALDPSLADAWMNLGSVCGAQGDYHAARRAFAEALKLDSASAEAYANLRLATSLAFSQ